MTLLATVVDVDALWQTVWSAALAGVAVTIVFSLGVLGATRSLESRRDRRGGAAMAYGMLAALGGAGTLALIAFGIALMATK